MLLLLGPPNSGKLGRLLEWWGSCTECDPVVVVPTAPDAHETTLEMIERKGALFGGLPAQTFDGLVAEVLGHRPRYVTAFERHLILAKILDGAKTGALRSMRGFPGTLHALDSLVGRLGESGRSSGEIVGLFDAWQKVDHEARALAGDLASVLRSYYETLSEQGLTDRPAAVREAEACLGAWGRPVAFYGFTSFTRGQTALIETLATRVSVVMSLAYEDRRSVNLVEEREVQYWRERAAQVVQMSSQDHAYSSPTIAFLERNLFDPSADGPPPHEPPSDSQGAHGVRFLSSSGRQNEAEVAAQHIASLLRAGFAPERIGVVVRRLEGRHSLLAQVFRSCNIPFRVDIGHRFERTGLGHALLAGLESQLAGEAPVPGGLYGTAYVGDTAATGSFAGAVRPRKGHLSFGLIDIDGLEALARQMLLRALDGVEVTTPEAEDDVRSFRALGQALESLRALSASGDDASWVKGEIVLKALRGLTVPSGPMEGRGAVQIVSPQRARARRFDAVFVLGLVEGEFPGHSDTPLLLTEAQRRRIDHLGGGGVLPARSDSEAALFLSVVSRAWQVLYLSSRDSDDGGGEVVPSRFWSESRALLGQEGEMPHGRSLAQQTYSLEHAPSGRHHRRALAVRYRSEGRASTAAQALCGTRRWSRGAPGLHDARVLEDLAMRAVFSPSELEQYLRCPFSWFIQRTVGAEPVDAELDGRVRGELLHAALSITYRTLADEHLLPLRPRHCERAIEIAAGAVEDVVARDSCPGSPTEKRIVAASLKHSIDRYLHTECGGEVSMPVVETEVPVGGDGGVDIGGLDVKGRIDRVDVDPDSKSLFVVDYKSGDIPGPKALGSAEGLQIPLYLMALGVERPEYRVLGGAYVSLRKDTRSGVLFDGAEDLLGQACRGCKDLGEEGRDGLFSSALEVALSAAEGIRSGRIAPPEPRKCPRWCDYGPICRSKVGGYRL